VHIQQAEYLCKLLHCKDLSPVLLYFENLQIQWISTHFRRVHVQNHVPDLTISDWYLFLTPQVPDNRSAIDITLPTGVGLRTECYGMFNETGIVFGNF